MSDVWAQLLSSALVGVQRRPCVLGPAAAPLETVIPAGPVDEAGLLHAAGTVTLAGRAGALAEKTAIPAPVVLVEETLVPPAAAARVSALLGGVRATGDQRGMRRLLHEWLELAAVHHRRSPAHLLPALLDLADQDGTLRPLVVAVGGTRAAWLAGLRPQQWGWMREPGEPAETAWTDGDTNARVAYLGAVRERDSAEGRRLLLETWKNESAADLAKLIGACRSGLDPADEEWLEKALDDRRVQVRSAAVPLLQRLPGSAYAGRMAERVAAWFHADGRKTIRVEFPAEFDPSMKRDGIEQKSAYGRGEKAWWIEQVVAAAPLSCWRTIDEDPAVMLKRSVGDDLGQVLRRGLTSATLAQRDARWAKELCGMASLESYAARPLVELLPPADAAEVALAGLQRRSGFANAFLSGLDRPWPADVSAAVVAKLGTAQLTEESGWRSLVTHAESGLDPAYAADIEKLADGVSFGEVLRQLAAFLQIRSDIHREFAS
ncbi:DUF5691 domain-containing protein [Hamadaea tsunoensis]|uniref:DUF5691 domain-containing protein n=1 Tax=Hamadaea tsunoensis TaxID=53368 RepID=UPI0003FED8A5|nr:DUF5691 domain-containing protein [Hamadaea tsunoensis]